MVLAGFMAISDDILSMTFTVRELYEEEYLSNNLAY